MKKNKPYNYFLLLSAQIVFLLSCFSNNNTPDHLITTVISPDSVVIYSGNLERSTLAQKIALDEKEFKEKLTDKKNKSGKPITVLLKLSQEGGEGGILGPISNVIQWSRNLGITNFMLVDKEGKTFARFNSAEDTWRFIDSSIRSPITLDLQLPKDEEEPVSHKKFEDALNCILLGNDSVYCYQDSNYKKGAFYSLGGTNSFRKELLRFKKMKANKFTVIIKPTESATYKSRVDILDEMTINNIKNYSLVSVADEELSFIKTKNSNNQ